MGIIVWLIFGGLAGWIASKIMGTDAQQGILLNIIVGIVGAFIGSYLFPSLGLWDLPGLPGAILSATLGAVILLFVIGLIRRVA